MTKMTKGVVDLARGILSEELAIAPENLDSPEGWGFVKEKVSDHGREAMMEFSVVMYYVYLILEGDLWKHEKFPDGSQVYQHQRHFIEEGLSGLSGLSKTMIYYYYKGLRLAFNNSLGYNLGDVISRGGVKTFAYAAESLEMDRRGQVKGLGGGAELPQDFEGDVEDYIRDTIDNIAPAPGEFSPPNPGHVRQQLSQALGHTTSIWFEVMREPQTRKEVTIWYRNETMPDARGPGQTQGFIGQGAPPDVLREYCRRLRCKMP